ncbi:MAG TPA: HEAT repeat domain-containing protein [Chryseosolibacter sp.]|nr:HEAT repeat domain-containing protein [Chryseosolibacter sp.]
MEREQLESLIIDYIDNKLNNVDRQKVETELMRNAEAYKLYEELKEVLHVMEKTSAIEPGQKAKAGFAQALNEEIASQQRGKLFFFSPALYRVAAAVTLLVLGVGIGYWISKHNEQREELIAIKTEMQQTKMLMMRMLNNDQSASQRIQGVNVANRMVKADDEIVKALVNTMNEDPSSNVRLAALDALSKFTNDIDVRDALARSLSKQNDPVVQIALIQLLVKMKEKGVIEDLKRIVDDAETMKAVKDEAYSGIMKLS